MPPGDLSHVLRLPPHLMDQIAREVTQNNLFQPRADSTPRPEDVQPLTLTSPWSNKGSGYRDAGYYKDQLGRVYLVGTITGGAAGDDIATLPVGYRPDATLVFFCSGETAAFNASSVRILATGVMRCMTENAASPTELSLDGISFRIL